MTRFKVALALVVLLSAPVSAQESIAYAQMAKATWSAFECSSLAAKLKNSSEQERLFRLGYEQGKEFIAALQAGKIERKDLSSNAPIGLLWVLEGPTPDFMLGRIYESAQDNALKDVLRTGESPTSEAEQQLIASNKFTSANCQLIGNGR